MLQTKKIISFLLIILVVGYAGGINIAKHLCDGEVVSKALNHEAKICKKASQTNSSNQDPGISELPCCKTVFGFQQSDSFEESSLEIVFIDTPSLFCELTYLEPLEELASINYESPHLFSPPIYLAIEQYLI